MAKRPPRTTQKIQDYAERRGGANYQDSYRAAKQRLQNLANDFGAAPASYKPFVLVGICTALESHLKYFYAHATDRYASYPDVLRTLLRDVNVDIDTIISISTSSFQLSDVVAAAISASTLEAYLAKASKFISVIHGHDHSFPWSYQEIFTESDAEWKQEINNRLARLRLVFDLRHRLVHETDVLTLIPQIEDAETEKAIENALWLMGEFEKIYWESEFDPGLNTRRKPTSLSEEADWAEAELTKFFEKLSADIEERQRESCEAFRKSFTEYLWSRSQFLASTFITHKSEETMAAFIDLVSQYLPILNRVFLEQHFLRAKFPVARQEIELLGERFGSPEEIE